MNNGVDETQTIDANLILTINNTLYLTNNAANGIDALFNVRGDVGTLSGCPGIVLDGSNTDNNTVSGDIAFDAQVRKRSAGKWILSGDNTYNRNTSIEQGILSVASIGDVNGAASNLGIPDTIGRGTINFGKDATTGQLTYTGTGETTDRVINLQGTTGGAIIDQSGTGALVFSSALTATGAGAKTLTLQGSTAGTGELQGAIVDSGGGATSVTKSGTGTWTLSGVSTYTGTTTVNDGTLVATTSASALGAGTLTMDGGTLQLANDTALAFNRNTTVAAACEIDSLRLTAGDGSGITHTLGTLSIGAFTLTVGMGDALTTSGVQGLTFGDGTLTGDAGITVTNTRAGGNGLLTLGAVNSNDATDRAFTITAGGTDDVTVGAIGTAAGTDLKTVTITGNDITIAGIGGAASGVTGATSITAATSGADAGSITLIGTAYNTAGTQSYDAGAAANTITLNEDTAFTTTSDDVTFTGLVDSQGAETNNITVTTVAGNVTFNQDVGSTSPVGTFNIASSNQADLANIIADGNITVTGTNIDLNSTTYTSSNGLITFTGATDLLGATTVTSGGGAGDDITFAGAVDLGGANLLTINAGAAGDAGITGIVSGAGGGLTKEGAGTLTLNGANTYTGATTVNAGILTAGIADQAFGVGSAVTVANGATLDLANNNETIGSLAGAGTVTSTGGASSLIIGGDNTSTSFSGTIDSVGGKIALTKVGTGTLALTTANTYSGDTTITTGTLRVSNANAVGTGNIIHNATLDIGSTTLNIAGAYTQGGASTLMVTVNGAAHGSLAVAGVCTVNATDSLVLAVSSTYIAPGATYTIIDGAAGGAIVAPTITTTGNSRVTFTATTVGDSLILTASRSSSGYASTATSSDTNAQTVGNVLDNITNPSADMTTVLNTMDGLSNSQVAAALDSMVPEVDAGVINTSTTVLNNFIGVAMDRVENVLTLAKIADSTSTGISTGEASKLNGIWAKGYGSYLTQGMRNNIAGYDAWNAGTALGADHIFFNTATLGVSGGYAYGDVDSDVNNANTYINSAQVTVYGGYADPDIPYFIDAAGSFAYNWYNGKRDIVVGPTITRTANAEYDGQQYGTYIGGGYTFNVKRNLEFTPLVSLQWNHLHLEKYTETEAGALNLSVDNQDYDQLQSGLGARIAAPIKYKWGTLTPEAHGKWFYDFIGDNMTVTSNFTGGGAAFNSNGTRPARSSFNAGGQLIFEFNNDISLIGNCDTEMKDEFFGIYGSGTVRYQF